MATAEVVANAPNHDDLDGLVLFSSGDALIQFSVDAPADRIQASRSIDCHPRDVIILFVADMFQTHGAVLLAFVLALWREAYYAVHKLQRSALPRAGGRSLTIFRHVVHTIRPIRGDTFDRWVDFYANDVVPAMERNGFDVLGGWKFSTGRMNEDLLLTRFESLSELDKAYASLMQDRKMASRLAAVMRSGVMVEERVTLARPVSYAEERLVEQALEAKPEKPRQYLLATIQMNLGSQARALEINGNLFETLNKGTAINLVAAYESISGQRGELNHLSVLPNGVLDLSYRRANPAMDQLLGALREFAPEESLRYLNPLPYSRLQ